MDADFTLIEEDQKPYVTFAEKHGVNAEEAKKKWDEAEKKASEELGVSVDKFSGKEYGYTMAIFKKMLGVKESFTVGKKLILEGVVLREGSQVEVLEESLSTSLKEARLEYDDEDYVVRDKAYDEREKKVAQQVMSVWKDGNHQSMPSDGSIQTYARSNKLDFKELKQLIKSLVKNN